MSLDHTPCDPSRPAFTAGSTAVQARLVASLPWLVIAVWLSASATFLWEQEKAAVLRGVICGTPPATKAP